MSKRSVSSFAKAVVRVESAKTMQNILRDILTPAELNQVNMRWAIIKELSRKETTGRSQKDIAKLLQVSEKMVGRAVSAVFEGGTGELAQLAKISIG